ncbi:MAG: hypothetical protein ACI9JY_000635 [Saprospiraceae bacterium]|jgi:hypothetical protein
MQYLFDKCKFFNKKVLINVIFNTKNNSQIGYLKVFNTFFDKINISINECFTINFNKSLVFKTKNYFFNKYALHLKFTFKTKRT